MLLKAKLYTPGFRASSLVDDSFQRINPFPWRAILCRIGNVQKLGNTNVTKVEDIHILPTSREQSDSVQIGLIPLN